MLHCLKKNPENRHEKDLNLIVPFIKENSFFKRRKIQMKHLTEVCSELRYEYHPAHEFVFHQGDYGDKFYIILKGKVQVLEIREEWIKMKKE